MRWCKWYIRVAVGIGLNGGSQDVESLKAKDLAKDEKIKRLEQENAGIKKENNKIRNDNIQIQKEIAGIRQANTATQLENTEIKERLKRIEKAMARGQ